jgi:toxin ParE1/3/4
MTLPLLITSEAEEDLADAKAWYERQRAGLELRFILCVEATLEQIRRTPEAGTQVTPGVRRVVVRRFPYVVFYRIDPDQIAIVAVYHSKRDPRGWQSRT